MSHRRDRAERALTQRRSRPVAAMRHRPTSHAQDIVRRTLAVRRGLRAAFADRTRWILKVSTAGYAVDTRRIHAVSCGGDYVASRSEYAMTFGPSVSPSRDSTRLTISYIGSCCVFRAIAETGHICLERLCLCASSSGEEANDGEQERLLQNTVPDPQPPMLKGVDAGG